MDFKFQWTQEMSVNHNVLDDQHKKLFSKLNELLEAIVDESAGDMVRELVDFFENYMNKHLTYEEQYLKDIGYPYTEEHHEQHEVFIKKYNETGIFKKIKSIGRSKKLSNRNVRYLKRLIDKTSFVSF